MKRLLAATILSASLTSVPAEAFSWRLSQNFATPFGGIGVSVPVSGETVFGVATVGLSAAGVYYVLSRVPSWRLSWAQQIYDSLDKQVVTFLENMDKETDLNAFTARLYPCSAYPLVAMFNALCNAHKSTKSALESLDAALWWSKDSTIIVSCKALKGLLNDRIQPFESAMGVLRAQTAWMQQYGLYMQECNNERLARLETAIQFQTLRNR